MAESICTVPRRGVAMAQAAGQGRRRKRKKQVAERVCLFDYRFPLARAPERAIVSAGRGVPTLLLSRSPQADTAAGTGGEGIASEVGSKRWAALGWRVVASCVRAVQVCRSPSSFVYKTRSIYASRRSSCSRLTSFGSLLVHDPHIPHPQLPHL